MYQKFVTRIFLAEQRPEVWGKQPTKKKVNMKERKNTDGRHEYGDSHLKIELFIPQEYALFTSK